ncbi:Lrp/AsnC family transcriptional regulator [Thermococcus sp. MV5]|uniref:Lrp/AsnC ligand binding domain-containing protein n=1 Tax=Thermococcus sp. MV5 TaxID=1638272 RepID=UPI001439A1B8
MPKGIMAFLFVGTEPKNRQIPVENEIVKIKGVVHVYEVLGEYDMCIHVQAKSREDLARILYTVSTIEGVRTVTTIIISKKIK